MGASAHRVGRPPPSQFSLFPKIQRKCANRGRLQGAIDRTSNVSAPGKLSGHYDMARIVISHSVRDRDAAQALATFLEGLGWSVWRDSSDTLHKASNAAIGDAELVIVIWSNSSVAAPYVLQAAIAARDAGKLLHLMNSEAQPKQIPVRRANEHVLDTSDLVQISLAVSSFMRQKTRTPAHSR
jgi:hypothetical protein